MAVGKVIKGDAAIPDSVPDRPSVRARAGVVVSAEVYEAKKGGEEITAEARQRAEAIIADAEAKKDAIFRKAEEEGRQQGLAQMAEQIAKAKIQAGELLAQHEQDVIQLACKLAEKISGRDLEREPQALIDLCATAVENVRNAKALILRVSPKAAAVLRQHKKDLMELIGRSMDVAIKEDPEVEDIGCIIQTEFGTIDAQLMPQLQMIKQVLSETEKKDGPA
jgi:type III secretion protein L